MSDADNLAVAREAFRKFQDRALAESPLGQMARWVSGGAPPPSQVLRLAGFRYDAAPDNGLWVVRKAFNRHWGFSIPCAEAVEAICACGPLVEVGAGTGYWSAMLAAAGADVIATDATASGNIGYGFEAGRYASVEQIGAVAAAKRHSARTVFCSWPSRGDPWALGVAWALERGRRLALIIEPRDGFTASAGLYRCLATRYRFVRNVIIPQFPKNRDRLVICERV